MDSIVCIIPARGGSKRIPKKNILNFFDKPLIAWTIEAARTSEIFKKVIVSTDSEEIAEVALKYGAEVPFFRQEKNDDISTVSEATIATLRQLKSEKGLEFQNVVQLMANCPLRDKSDILNSYNNFISKNLNYQLSSFKFGWMNPWWAVRVDENRKPIALFPEGIKTRSQDLPDLFCPTGAIWIAKTESLLKSNSFYGPGYEFCEVGWISAIDIDDLKDLEMAKAAYLIKNKMI